MLLINELNTHADSCQKTDGLLLMINKIKTVSTVEKPKVRRGGKSDVFFYGIGPADPANVPEVQQIAAKLLRTRAPSRAPANRVAWRPRGSAGSAQISHYLRHFRAPPAQKPSK